MNRSRRLAILAQLLGGRRYSSQEELVRALGSKGIEVTQATLSRDLKSLGVLKGHDASGAPTYELPGPPLETYDRERRLLDLKAFVNDVRVANNLVMVRTPPGHANGVGRAIDLAEFPGVLGTVAGDDTVLVVMQDLAHARKLKQRLDVLGEAAAVAPVMGGSAK